MDEHEEVEGMAEYVKHNRPAIPDMMDWFFKLDPRFRDAVIDNLMAITIRMYNIQLQTHSPIEFLLGMYLRSDLLINHFGFEASVLTQVEIETKGGTYRADFVVTAVNGEKRLSIVVECDGHEFHEKTKDQAQRDKKRDRDLQKAGYRVLRFTGSEIWKDPASCVKEVASLIQMELHDQK